MEKTKNIEARIVQLMDMQEAHPEIKGNLQAIINHLKGLVRIHKREKRAAMPLREKITNAVAL